MEITIKKIPITLLEPGTDDDLAIVELVGNIDGSTASKVQAQVLPIAETNSRVILDMTQVPYMSSAGLRMLLSVYRQVLAKEGQVVLVGLAEELQDTMSVTGFLDFFTTCATIDEGCTALSVKVQVLS
ncbi:MAG: STAS domain-containing protein [Leptolyngbyaceae cyanobacterium SU_3_3]|nr:STAS domain-containing protein [Leptolyngbyaceae cyanobacterium SU_3_3]NJR50619.1 STAS domain-containing protein [Leptolyngbyaceae cyanobacterium CSU_1_3]